LLSVIGSILHVYVCVHITHLGMLFCDYTLSVDYGIYELDQMRILVLIDIAKSCTNLNSHQQFMTVLMSAHSSVLYTIRLFYLY
jgi:hypothetical protein